MLTLISFLAVISLLAFVHELGHFLAAKLSGVKVEEFGIGFPPRVFSFRRGETLYSLNLLPLGGFVRLLGEEGRVAQSLEKRAFYAQPIGRKIPIILGGVLMNFLLALVLLAFFFARYGEPRVTYFLQIEEVKDKTPAAAMGLKKGDKIRAFRLEENKEWQLIQQPEEFTQFLQNNSGNFIYLLLQKESKKEVKSGWMRYPAEAAGEAVSILGIVYRPFPQINYRRVSLIAVPRLTLLTSFNLVKESLRGLKRMLSFFWYKRQLSPEITGPIGIARITGITVREGGDMLIHFVALLSLSLAIFNILPFPALDGGRLVLALAEFFFRRQLNLKWQRWINALGLAILLLFMLYVTFWDLQRWFF